VKPDIVTLAKGITSAYFPVSASVISDKIWNVLQNASAEYGPVMHGFTYSGHPVGGAIGMANLDIMERENLIENSATLGTYFLRKLRERVAAIASPRAPEARKLVTICAVVTSCGTELTP